MSSPWSFQPRKTLPKGRMTKAERTFYLIGAAVMQQLAMGPHDPATRRSETDVINWVAFWLSQEDLEFLERMGRLFDPDEDELENESGTVPGFAATNLDDDIPF